MQFPARSDWKMNSQATEYCQQEFGGTNIIVSGQEITGWVVRKGVGEHWIGANKVPSIFPSGRFLILTILLQGGQLWSFFLARWDTMGIYTLEWRT